MDGDTANWHPHQWHSLREDWPWLRITLAVTAASPAVTFFSRNCCQSDYAGEVNVYLSDTSETPNWATAAPCIELRGVGASRAYEHTCAGSGRYLFVTSPGNRRYLEIPEIRVMQPQ